MKVILAILFLCGLIAFVLVIESTSYSPVPHLDPPVVTVKHECGSELDTATVAALFDTCGYHFKMESITNCEKVFYIYKGEK